MPDHSDKELLNMFRDEASRHHAFNLIVRKYQEKVYWHIRRMVISHDDANDVMQNTFIKAWKGLKNFRGEAGLFTWLYRIATNESITFLNKRKKRFYIPMVNVEEKLANSLESDEYFNGDEIAMKLQKAILTLPEKQRLVFNMKYFDEMKYEEMSEILDTSVGALKASFHHAKKKIEDQIKSQD